MTEAQYAAALASAAAETRRAWDALEARMSKGIARERVKAPVVVAIIAALRERAGMTTDELMTATGYSRRTVQDAVKSIQAAGRCRVEARGYDKRFTLVEASE